MKVSINGKLCDRSTATISIDDRGLLLGDGLFETLLVIDGKPIFFRQHYDRLGQSAQQLMIPLDYSCEQLQTACMDLLAENQLIHNQAALRITLTRGVGDQRGIDLPMTAQPNLIITANAYKPMNTNNLRMTISTTQRNQHSPLNLLKTLNYLESIICKAQAQELGFDDGIILNSDGNITETSTANIFFIGDNVVYTPSIDSGILPGIVRAQIIELCKTLDIRLEQTLIDPNAIADMDLAFISNSLIGIVPVQAIGDIRFTNLNNPLFKHILEAYSDILSKEFNGTEE